MRVLTIFVLFFLLVAVGGCTSTQKGMTAGALGGGVAGGSIGYFAREETTDDAIAGAAIGALTGAVVGGIIGYFSGE